MNALKHCGLSPKKICCCVRLVNAFKTIFAYDIILKFVIFMIWVDMMFNTSMEFFVILLLFSNFIFSIVKVFLDFSMESRVFDEDFDNYIVRQLNQFYKTARFIAFLL
jgi:hypothetical protein